MLGELDELRKRWDVNLRGRTVLRLMKSKCASDDLPKEHFGFRVTAECDRSQTRDVATLRDHIDRNQIRINSAPEPRDLSGGIAIMVRDDNRSLARQGLDLIGDLVHVSIFDCLTPAVARDFFTATGPTDEKAGSVRKLAPRLHQG